MQVLGWEIRVAWIFENKMDQLYTSLEEKRARARRGIIIVKGICKRKNTNKNQLKLHFKLPSNQSLIDISYITISCVIYSSYWDSLQPLVSHHLHLENILNIEEMLQVMFTLGNVDNEPYK